jgi:ADP-ribose pyrophosphatase
VGLDKKFDIANVSIQEEETAYRGFFQIKKFLLKHALFRGGQSKAIQRELFCRGESVGVLLYDPEADRVGLAQQFRIGCLDNEWGPWVWEVIAGVKNKSENSEQVAIREVREESGIAINPDDLVPICNYYSSPGGSDERLQLYVAIVALKNTENIFGLAEENEDILFKTFDYPLVINAILSGEINNAATVIALQWLQLNRQMLREKFCHTQ